MPALDTPLYTDMAELGLKFPALGDPTALLCFPKLPSRIDARL